MSEWAAKRFWKEATVADADEGFTVHLDGRGIKTPAKASLVVPTVEMAQAVAAEWDAQDGTIDPLSMPVTRAVNAAIDKVRVQQPEVAALIADYGGSDLLCYRATGPEILIERQAAAWDPYLEWAVGTLGVSLRVTQGIVHVEQPANALEIMQTLVGKQGPFSLTALHDLVSLTGSLILGLAAQRGDFNPGVLWKDATVDETFQAELWGHDEEAHEALQTKASAFENAANFQRLTNSPDFSA